MSNGRRNAALISGIAMLTAGVLLLLHQFQVLSLNFSIICGASMLLCSAVFHVFAIAKRSGGLAYPAGVLLVYGGLVLAMGIAGWEWMRLLWPLWIFGAAVGGIEQKLISRDHTGSWYSILILLAVTAGSFAVTAGVFDFRICLGIGLVVVGLMIALRPLFTKGRKEEAGPSATYTVHYETPENMQAGSEPAAPPPPPREPEPQPAPAAETAESPETDDPPEDA